MHAHQAFIRVFFSTIMLLATIPSYAFGNLSADEVRSLFSGNTVEGDYLEGQKQSVQNFYLEPFISYFADNGKVYSIRVREKTKEIGDWRINKKGYLCLNWEGTKEKCAPIYKDGDRYKQDMKNKVGKIKWTNIYATFTAGKTKALQDW